ncbi:MAG: tryptophan synthase subunit alpha [Spirochaetales bacterium]|nr:tryptophan synthase subunit alpha [Spirochaetales bacterium]
MADTLMTHFIAGYPSVEESLKVGKALVAGGASYLEMQIPYSDPTADGPVIAAACDEALAAGFKVDRAFDMCRELTSLEGAVPVFLMSYGGIVYNAGVEAFVARAKEAGASGLIIPDLAPGADEGLAEACKKAGLFCVPVLIPGVTDGRMEEVLADKPEWVYLALRRGITGTLTELGPENMDTLDKLKAQNVKIMAGFGIQQRSQVESVAPHCDAVIVGSQVIRTVNECPAGDYSKLEAFVQELIG